MKRNVGIVDGIGNFVNKVINDTRIVWENKDTFYIHWKRGSS